jgi:hypothetical protein
MKINYNLITMQKLFRFILISTSAMSVKSKQEMVQFSKIKKLYNNIKQYQVNEDLPQFD